MKIERDKAIAAIGGSKAIQKMDSEAKAEALGIYLSNRLDAEVIAKGPTVADLEE